MRKITVHDDQQPVRWVNEVCYHVFVHLLYCLYICCAGCTFPTPPPTFPPTHHLLHQIEWINDTIWGNVWQTECLVQINPENGAVMAWALFDGITRHAAKRSRSRQRMDVFNGVAWDEERQRMFVTGKHWPLMYEVMLHQQHGTAEERAALHHHALQHCVK